MKTVALYARVSTLDQNCEVWFFSGSTKTKLRARKSLEARIENLLLQLEMISESNSATGHDKEN